MPTLVNCWKKVKESHPEFSLGDEDYKSVVALTKQHLDTGVPYLDAAKAAVQSHMDEAHAQLQSIYKQTGVAPKPIPKPEAPPVQPPTQKPEVVIPPEDIKYTGVANRVYDRLTEEGQLGEVPSGTGRSTADSIAIGRKRLAEGADPNVIANRFWKTRRISDTEFAVLRAHSENLHGMSLAAEKEMKANPTPENTAKFEQSFQAFHDFSRNVVQPAKTATSNIFRAMQDEEPLHVDSYTGLREALNREAGRDVKPSERPIFEKAAENVQAATNERNGAAEKIDVALKKAAPKSVKIVTNDDLRGHIAKIMKDKFPCP